MSAESKRLYRSRSSRMISGVAGGLGEYFGIDPTLVRLFFVFGVFFLGIPGTLALAYLILAIVVPEEPAATIITPSPVEQNMESNQPEFTEETMTETNDTILPPQSE